MSSRGTASGSRGGQEAQNRQVAFQTPSCAEVLRSASAVTRARARWSLSLTNGSTRRRFRRAWTAHALSAPVPAFSLHGNTRRAGGRGSQAQGLGSRVPRLLLVTRSWVGERWAVHPSNGRCLADMTSARLRQPCAGREDWACPFERLGPRRPYGRGIMLAFCHATSYDYHV